MVLKRKFRIGTHLQDECLSPDVTSPYGANFMASMCSPNHYQSPSCQYNAPGILPSSSTPPPPYRSPPPYNPPPESGNYQVLSNRDDVINRDTHNQFQYQGSKNVIMGRENEYNYNIEPHNAYRTTSELYRRGSFQDPSDLGIPPAPPMNRSSSSTSLLSSISEASSSHRSGTPGGNVGLPTMPNNSYQQQFYGDLEKRKSIGSLSSHSGSRTSLTHTASVSSITSLDNAPVVPPRRKNENKENEGHKWKQVF